jgi:hypothetical protein
VSGSVTLGDEVMMGTHSAILQGLTTGARPVAGRGRASSRTCRPTRWSRVSPRADSALLSLLPRPRRPQGLVRTTSCCVARVIAT